MGLFGVAVGTLTLGLAQAHRTGITWNNDRRSAFGGMQFLAGIASIRFHEPFRRRADGMRVLITLCTTKLVSAGTTFQLSPVPYAAHFVYLSRPSWCT
jgi:hypothetical protein